MTRIAELGELARRRQDEADDAALRRCVSGLADLAIESRHRGGADDHAALAVGERFEPLHAGCDKPHRIESADQVDANDALKIGEWLRTVAADDAFRRADARAIDQNARRAVVGGGFGDRRLGRGAVGHVAMNGDAVGVDRDLGGGLSIHVEDGDLGAGLGQHARSGGPEAGAAAGNDRCMSANIHGQLACCVCPHPPPLAGEGTAGDDHVRRRRVGVKRLHQSRAMGEHRALVDRSFVGDLADIERWRFGEQNGAADAGRSAAARVG